MKEKSASVKIVDGVTVVNFKEIYYLSACKNVEVISTEGVAEITVKGQREIWENFSYDLFDHNREYSQEWIDKVQDQYVEMYNLVPALSWWKRLLGYRSIDQVAKYRVKEGWAQLKEEYEEPPFTIRTSLYRIVTK